MRKLNSALTKTQHLLEEAREKEEAAIALELDIRAQFNKLSAQYEEAQSRLVLIFFFCFNLLCFFFVHTPCTTSIQVQKVFILLLQRNTPPVSLTKERK